ncbi:MAG: hypothetical protein C5B54_01310, partial [Acidobacteria bacterium]
MCSHNKFMPIACPHKVEQGAPFCIAEEPVDVPCGAFLYQRIEQPDQIPPPNENIIDIAILDMNHGWPNLGHDSIVHLIKDAACDILTILQSTGLSLRALSYDIRRTAIIPEKSGGRFRLYLGTGGPGHIDPHQNDGKYEGSQGIVENIAWEAPLFRLFDSIYADENSALLAVCHTFGVMCRWSGIARAVLRGPEEGGKSSGVLENILTPEGQQHPWFRHFAEMLPGKNRLRIMDSRLYDLILNGSLKNGATPIGFETVKIGGPQGKSVTMMEWVRDKGGIMPRIFAVNHHPEIIDRKRQLQILQRKFDHGEVTREWYEERLRLVT